MNLLAYGPTLFDWNVFFYGVAALVNGYRLIKGRMSLAGDVTCAVRAVLAAVYFVVLLSYSFDMIGLSRLIETTTLLGAMSIILVFIFPSLLIPYRLDPKKVAEATKVRADQIAATMDLIPRSPAPDDENAETP